MHCVGTYLAGIVPGAPVKPNAVAVALAVDVHAQSMAPVEPAARAATLPFAVVAFGVSMMLSPLIEAVRFR